MLQNEKPFVYRVAETIRDRRREDIEHRRNVPMQIVEDRSRAQIVLRLTEHKVADGLEERVARSDPLGVRIGLEHLLVEADLPVLTAQRPELWFECFADGDEKTRNQSYTEYPQRALQLP